MTSHVKDLFVPAAGVHWLTPLYDPAVALLTRERRWRPRLVNQIATTGRTNPRPWLWNRHVTVMLQQACPEAEVIGFDIDRDALRIARAKADAAGTRISFWQRRADDPSTVPMFRFASFDKIVSALLFHHLPTEQKLRALAHARNLLRVGGEMHVADWGKPANRMMRILFYSVQALDGYANTSDNVAGRLPEYMREAGFSDVTETHREATVLGTLSFYGGVRA
jgi:SAM-dependent methyltransferase